MCEIVEDWEFDLWNGPDLHQAHVLRFQGFDLFEQDILDHEFNDCPFCIAKYEKLKKEPGNERFYEQILLLTDDVFHDGQTSHYVVCGDCGARGPVKDTESKALNAWNLNP